MKTSRDIAVAIMEKIEDAKNGRNLSGAETMCKCVNTLINLARLEMEYARVRSECPSVSYLVGGEPALSKKELQYRAFRETIKPAKEDDES